MSVLMVTGAKRSRRVVLAAREPRERAIGCGTDPNHVENACGPWRRSPEPESASRKSWLLGSAAQPAAGWILTEADATIGLDGGDAKLGEAEDT